ncbi:MAG TPA: ring-opening amidohydrolase [Hyphomicrobiaceae bacterium]
MRAGVFRLAMSHPGDVSAVERLILTGTVRARGGAVIVGRTEDRGGANDITRGNFAQGLMGLLSRHLEEPAEAPATRIPCALSEASPAPVAAPPAPVGAEHRGPESGGPVAVIAERLVTSRSTSCAS